MTHRTALPAHIFVGDTLYVRRDTRFDNPKVERRETHKYGLGVFAREPIEKDELISSFDGAFGVGPSALQLPEHPTFSPRHAIQCGPYMWRDGKKDGIARYVAHSCEPNCGIHGLFDIVAMRPILAGEELTWDYAMSERSDFRMQCLCGSPHCIREVGSFDLLDEHVKAEYGGYISHWLTAVRTPGCTL